MLVDWVSPALLAEFERAVLETQAWAKPRAAAAAVAICDWNRIAAVLRVEPAPDVLVVARGELRPEAPPATLHQLRALMQRGLGICIRRAERCDAALASVADGLAHEAIACTFPHAGGTWPTVRKIRSRYRSA